MADTKITWAEKVWNPATGCTKTSDGCRGCYAEKMANRLKAMGIPKYEDGFEVRMHDKSLKEPLGWKKAKRIFVCSMSDLFHDDITLQFMEYVWDIMIKSNHHTYLILTKRPRRLHEFYDHMYMLGRKIKHPNIHIGVTVENGRYKNRVDVLRSIPAHIRFLSIEPLIGDIGYLNLKGIDWVIVGAESGPNRRPCKIEWIRDIVRQCKDASVPVFVKQMEINGKITADPADWPVDLRIQEFPR